MRVGVIWGSCGGGTEEEGARACAGRVLRADGPVEEARDQGTFAEAACTGKARLPARRHAGGHGAAGAAVETVGHDVRQAPAGDSAGIAGERRKARGGAGGGFPGGPADERGDDRPPAEDSEGLMPGARQAAPVKPRGAPPRDSAESGRLA